MPRCRHLTMCREEKALLRKKWSNIRNNIENREQKSREICKNALRHPAVLKAETVFVYISFKSEPDTKFFIDELLRQNKRVAVPLCDVKTHTMEAVLLEDINGLKTGAYGILEPDKTWQRISKSEIDVIIVPALAFDKDGYRLGYGAGYYDRFLKGFGGYAIGFAFSDCIAGRLPREKTDMKIDEIITEMR